jgi:CheY-like chemotaxis protein/HPt (histidine-containing phosphotransfer) domain-containing protein
LEKFGCSVKIADNGQQALDMLALEKFDLILMDCQMPVMDGYTATREIRNPKSHLYDPKIPIIALTAHIGPEEEARTQLAGMSDYLSKPVRKTMLGERLNYWLDAAMVRKTADKVSGVSGTHTAAYQTQEPKTCGKAEEIEMPIFDIQGVQERLEDDDELLRELIKVFMEGFDERLAAMHEAIAAGNASEAGDIAHALKGGSSNVGAERLRKRFYAMEVAGREGKLETLTELARDVSALAAEYTRVLKEQGYFPQPDDA